MDVLVMMSLTWSYLTLPRPALCGWWDRAPRESESERNFDLSVQCFFFLGFMVVHFHLIGMSSIYPRAPPHPSFPPISLPNQALPISLSAYLPLYTVYIICASMHLSYLFQNPSSCLFSLPPLPPFKVRFGPVPVPAVSIFNGFLPLPHAFYLC